MSLNKWLKCIRQVMAGERCKILDIKQTKSHLKIYTVLPLGEKRMFVTGVSPSDGRKGLLNFRGDVRRAIRYERENFKRG